MHIIKRTANLLGTLSVAVDDRIRSIDADSLDHNATAAAALITIGNYPEQNITELSVCLRLSQSATVRLVEKLVTTGLVDRNPGADKRISTLSLTQYGSEFVDAVLTRRRADLENMLSVLAPDEQEQFARLLDKMLGHATCSPQIANQLCRFCDLANCPQETCPVEQRARLLR